MIGIMIGIMHRSFTKANHLETQETSPRHTMKSAITTFSLLLLGVVPVDIAYAQTDHAPITVGNYRRIHSQVLNADRTLLICLPEDYDKTNGTYPVIYKLDGGMGGVLWALGPVGYLAGTEGLPADHIVVGIVSTERAKDFEPGPSADAFVRFIKTELVPFVETHYRTTDFRILIGQSYSSLFALHLFVREPDLFAGFILSSLSLYRESQQSIFTNNLKDSQHLTQVGKKYIFVTQGKLERTQRYDPDGSREKRGAQFLELLKQTAPNTVFLETKIYDDEGHVPFPSIYDGLVWIYSQVGKPGK